jgi:repressor LexA
MPTETALTPHQRTVLSFIREFQQKRGYSPSLADLAVAFGVKSKNAIAKVVNALSKNGYLAKDPKGRIKIFDQIAETVSSLSLPLFGPIAAGFAAPVEEQAEEKVTLEEYLVRDRNSTFLLRVRGDSMIDAGIHEGDLVIVVGVLDGEYTLKELIRENGKYFLRAKNPAYKDMYAMNELQVAGVVRGVVRKY